MAAPQPFVKTRNLLAMGAALSGSIAALHVAITLVGPAGYRYFGAPRLASAAARGALWPALLTLSLAGLFAVTAAYALSGSGRVRRLPLLQPVLLTIGAIYLLRGLLLVPELLALAAGTLPYTRALAFSSVSLLAGVCYLSGFVGLRRTPV